MATGQQSFDPDDFIRRDRERDERAREQQRIDEMRRSQEREQQRQRDSLQRMADVVNDPALVIDNDMMKAVNDPEMVMLPTGELARVTQRRSLGSQFGAQFGTGFGFDLPKDKPKKKSKRKKNPKLSAAFKEANRLLRTKNGKLRKGRTQADIARLAQRLRRKM